MESRKAIFIDKDGTLIPHIPYNVDAEKITLLPHVVEGLIKLQNQGYLLVVLNSQSEIYRGLFREREFERAQFKIETLLLANDIHLSGYYACPYHPKPSSGLFFRASRELSINLYESWMIGDLLNDVEAGNRAGCKSILLNNGNETEWKNGYFRKPAYIANDLSKAANFIVEHSYSYKKESRLSPTPFLNTINS